MSATDRGFGRSVQTLDMDITAHPAIDVTTISTEDLEGMLAILEKYEPNAAELAAAGELEIGSSIMRGEDWRSREAHRALTASAFHEHPIHLAVFFKFEGRSFCDCLSDFRIETRIEIVPSDRVDRGAARAQDAQPLQGRRGPDLPELDGRSDGRAQHGEPALPPDVEEGWAA